jgi:type IV secretory pathway TrbF-like protein
MSSEHERPSTDQRCPPSAAPPLEDAKRQYLELFGSALVMNTYLKIALVSVSIVAAGLTALNFQTLRKSEQVKPLVIRIDEVGRAQAVHYDALAYKPTGQAPELKYFLIQFITKYFGRMRGTVKAAHAESLFFLDSQLAEAAIADNQKHQTIEAFLTGTADEIEINVRNVALEEIRTPPFRASVDFEKVYYGVGNRQERTRETYVAQLLFVLRDQIPNALVPVNPLGLTITYVRIDQAFR